MDSNLQPGPSPQGMFTILEVAERLGCHHEHIKRLLREDKGLRPSAFVDGRKSLLFTEGDIHAIEERFPQLKHRRPRSKCLAQDELENARRAASSGALIRGHQPWDSSDGKLVLCLLCGFQRHRLAARRRGYSHLLDEHLDELGVDVYGDSKLATARYQDLCESRYGVRPPVTCFNEREDKAEWKINHPERVKEHRDTAAKRAKDRRHKDPSYRRQLNARFLARRQEKLLACLTEAEKDSMILCKLCEREGHPEYRFKTLRQHTSFHGWSLRRYRKEFRGAPTEMPEVKRDALARFEKGRDAARRTFFAAKPKKRGGSKAGWTKKGTSERITLAVDLLLLGVNKWKMPPHLYPIHFSKTRSDNEAAWKATSSFLTTHGAAIDKRKPELAALSKSERQAIVEAARRVIKTLP